MRLIALVVTLALASGCSSCTADADADADVGVDADSDRDVDDEDADPDRSDAERDSDEQDRDIDSPFDADCPASAGDGVRMDVVEVTSRDSGRECGIGCKQVTFAAPVFNGALYGTSGRYLTYVGDVGLAPIFLVDLELLREYRIDNDTNYQRTMPNTDGEHLVYATSGWGSSDLDMTLWRYNIGECARYPLVVRTMTEVGRPMTDFSVAGNIVAWYDSAIAAAGIYAMSLSGGDVIELTPDHCVCYGEIFLHGRTVVFEGWQTGPRNIWSVDIDTRVQTNLTNASFDQFEPDSDGEWVVWTDSRNDPSAIPYSNRYNPDIYGMPLPSGEERALCTDPSTQLHPAVGSGLVAWEDFRNAENPNDAWARDADIDIYLLDLSSGREVQVTSDPGQEYLPALNGRRLFYVANDDHGEPAVFMVDLEAAGLL